MPPKPPTYPEIRFGDCESFVSVSRRRLPSEQGNGFVGKDKDRRENSRAAQPRRRLVDTGQSFVAIPSARHSEWSRSDVVSGSMPQQLSKQPISSLRAIHRPMASRCPVLVYSRARCVYRKSVIISPGHTQRRDASTASSISGTGRRP